MTTNQLINQLKLARPNAKVFFDFCGIAPDEVRSWRGIYAEPALGWKVISWDEGHTVESLIEELNKAISGNVFYGYKGGEFQYDGDEPLHIDNDGEYTNTEISHIEDLGYKVVIHTKSNCD